MKTGSVKHSSLALRASDVRRLTSRSCDWVSLSLEAPLVQLRVSGSSDVLEVRVGDEPVRSATIVRRPTPLGVQWLFECPVRGKPVRTLYLAQGRFVSRQAARIAYPSQGRTAEEGLLARADALAGQLSVAGKGAVRGRNRERLVLSATGLLHQLRATDLVGDEYFRLNYAVGTSRAAGKRKVRKRRLRVADPSNGTKAALYRGRTQAPKSSVGEIRERARRIDRAGDEPKLPRPAAASTLEDYPELDLRLLRVRRGFAAGQTLLWSRPGGRCLLVQTLIDERALQLVIMSADSRQFIQLAKGQRAGDLFALCPVSGRRTVKLHWRNGRFASRQAQRLIHRSQLSRPQTLSNV